MAPGSLHSVLRQGNMKAQADIIVTPGPALLVSCSAAGYTSSIVWGTETISPVRVLALRCPVVSVVVLLWCLVMTSCALVFCWLAQLGNTAMIQYCLWKIECRNCVDLQAYVSTHLFFSPHLVEHKTFTLSVFGFVVDYLLNSLSARTG